MTRAGSTSSCASMAFCALRSLTTRHQSLRAALHWQKDAGADMRWLDPPAVARFEPGLGPSVQGAVHSATEGQVNPSLLTQALG